MTTKIAVPLAGGDVVFTVDGLDRQAWAELVLAHPSDDPRWRFDAATLTPALVAQCVTDPPISVELATELVDDPDTGTDLAGLCFALSDPGSWAWAAQRLAKDGRLAAEVAAAVRMGIPHAQFTGWPAASQDLALAWIESTQKVCPSCGVPEADMKTLAAWAPDTQVCVHCDALKSARDAVDEKHAHLVHIRLVRPEAG